MKRSITLTTLFFLLAMTGVSACTTLQPANGAVHWRAGDNRHRDFD